MENYLGHQNSTRKKENFKLRINKFFNPKMNFLSSSEWKAFESSKSRDKSTGNHMAVFFTNFLIKTNSVAVYVTK